MCSASSRLPTPASSTGSHDKVGTPEGALVVYNHQVRATPDTVYTIFQRRALRVRAGSVSCDQLEAMMMAANL